MSLSKIASLLKSSASPKTILAGVSALSPQIRSFAIAAGAAGYAADAVLDFLRDAQKGPSTRQREKDIKQRTASGMARPEEMAEAEEIESGERAGSVLRTAIGAGTGIASALVGRGNRQEAPEAPQLPTETAEPTAETPQESPGNFIQRALEGVQYFDLPEDIRAEIAPNVKQLDRLEQEGSEWGASPVQRLVKAIRGRVGLVDREQARFTAGRGEEAMQQQAGPQAQQGGSADAQVLQALQGLFEEFKNL